MAPARTGTARREQPRHSEGRKARTMRPNLSMRTVMIMVMVMTMIMMMESRSYQAKATGPGPVREFCFRK